MSNDFEGDFGLCPYCRKTDGYVNVGRSHWFLCDAHKVKWCFGSNLFSSWRGQTEEEQRREYDARGVGTYKEVKPFFALEAPSDDAGDDPLPYPFEERLTLQ